MKRSTLPVKSFLSLTLALLCPQLLLAQAGEDSGLMLEEVTVTAQKREQSFNDVGIAVDVFSADDIRELRLYRPEDVAAQSPNVKINNTLANATNELLQPRANLSFAVLSSGLAEYDPTAIDQCPQPGTTGVKSASVNHMSRARRPTPPSRRDPERPGRVRYGPRVGIDHNEAGADNWFAGLRIDHCSDKGRPRCGGAFSAVADDQCDENKRTDYGGTLDAQRLSAATPLRNTLRTPHPRLLFDVGKVFLYSN